MSGWGRFLRRSVLAGILVASHLPLAAKALKTDGLASMTGCWISDDFDPTSLLKDAAEPNSAEIVIEKMWLKFERIEGTHYLVLGHIYEWDRAGTYVIGPSYQNGVYNPAANFLTFGFPEGGLDHVTQPAEDKLLYVHSKSSAVSAMAVRVLSRIDCTEAGEIEADLLERQTALK